MAAARPLKLLIDTNVWLDNYLPGRPNGRDSRALLDIAWQRDDCLIYPASVLVDVMYAIRAELKRRARAAGMPVDESAGAAIGEVAWGCVENMRELGTAASVDEADLWLASKFHRFHPDFEDDVVLAVAQRVGADFLVTGDEGLLRRANVAALPPAEMRRYLQAMA